LQGADLLAYGNEMEQYQVYVPDFLLGQYAQHSWFPADTEEKSQAMNAFFQGPANPADTIQKIPNLVETISERSSGVVEKWAIVGKCWGGKVCLHATSEWLT
jgi:dienelactone hydrolase